MRLFFFVFAAWAAMTAPVFSQAVLRPGDTFEMRLAGMPLEYSQEFALQYSVSDEGTVTVPLIGPVRAVGLSTSGLAQAIAQRFQQQKIFTTPTVNINLLPQTRFVTVGGAVRMPSAIPWSQDMSLSSAIKRAGGASDFGNMKRVRVTRNGQTLVFNLRIADRDPNQNPRLLPGDEVEVSE